MTFFSWKMYSDKIIACYFKAFCTVELKIQISKKKNPIVACATVVGDTN